MRNMTTILRPVIGLALLVMIAGCSLGSGGEEVAAPDVSVRPGVTTATTAGSTATTAGTTATTGATTATTKPAGSPTTAKPSKTTNTTAKPRTKAVADGSGCSPGSGPLPDGRWYGLIAESGTDEVEFDLACYFTKDAALAATEDGQESPPPNDYYVRNTNKALRTVPVAAAATVRWYPNSGDPSSRTTVGYAEWSSQIEDRVGTLGVWLEIDGRSVIAIDEQWTP